jgi:hypothetical protein
MAFIVNNARLGETMLRRFVRQFGGHLFARFGKADGTAAIV